MSSIECRVGDCKYQQGQKCTAPSVNVKSLTGDNAQCCHNTQCETYEPRK